MTTEQQRLEDLVAFVENGVQTSKEIDHNESVVLSDLFDELSAEVNAADV